MNGVRFVRAEREHRRLLQGLVCTDPPTIQYDRHRGNFHPRLWEHTVQSHLRSLEPPLPANEVLALGMVDDRLASAVHFCISDDEPRQFVILALACQIDLHGRGLGRTTLDFALRVLAHNRRLLGLDIGAFARVHVNNEASKTVLRACGFEPVGVYAPRLETWVHDFSGVDVADTAGE